MLCTHKFWCLLLNWPIYLCLLFPEKIPVIIWRVFHEKEKWKTHTHTHTNSQFNLLLENFRISPRKSSVAFGHLWQSSEFLWQSAGICVSRRKSSETSTLGRRAITRMWGILCQAHMTAILDRIGIWKCWFLSKWRKPEYPEKNLSEQERESTNSTNSTHTMWTFKVYRNTPG